MWAQATANQQRCKRGPQGWDEYMLVYMGGLSNPQRRWPQRTLRLYQKPKWVSKGKISSLDEKAVGGCLRHTTNWRVTQTLPAKTKQGEYDAIFIFSMLHQVTSQAVRTSQASENQRELFPPSNSILIKTEKTGLICHNSNTNTLVTNDYGKKLKTASERLEGEHMPCVSSPSS